MKASKAWVDVQRKGNSSFFLSSPSNISTNLWKTFNSLREKNDYVLLILLSMLLIMVRQNALQFWVDLNLKGSNILKLCTFNYSRLGRRQNLSQNSKVDRDDNLLETFQIFLFHIIKSCLDFGAASPHNVIKSLLAAPLSLLSQVNVKSWRWRWTRSVIDEVIVVVVLVYKFS